jgi:hypothetical protein
MRCLRCDRDRPLHELKVLFVNRQGVTRYCCIDQLECLKYDRANRYHKINV